MVKKSVVLLLITVLFPVAAFAEDADQLFEAARKGDAAAVKALLAKGVNVNAKNHSQATPIFYAADNGHIEVVKLLIEKGADLSLRDKIYGNTPASLAIVKGHMEIVKLMLDKGAAISDGVFLTVTYSDNKELTKLLLEKGKFSPASLTSWVELAADGGKTELIALLKKAGAVMPPEANFAVDAETLQSYAGTYRSEDGQDTVVTFKNGKLFATVPGGQPFLLGAVDKTTFRPARMYSVSFKFNIVNGKVASVTYKQLGHTSESERQ